MGKKSRRKPPREPQRNEQPVVPHKKPDALRFRGPTDEFYGLHLDEAIKCLEEVKTMAEQITGPNSPEIRAELDTMTEFMCLVALPLSKRRGFECVLSCLRRWPKFRPHWNRVRRRVCDYCGRRNDLSEPRLWVCAGCGVARYCDKACQTGDFSHHSGCCLHLACSWDGKGPIPTQLLNAVTDPFNPTVVPSARARKRLEAWVTRPVTPEEVKRLRIMKK